MMHGDRNGGNALDAATTSASGNCGDFSSPSFYAYELVVFDRAAGRLTARHKLAGMPVSRVVYPGAFDEHGLLELSGDTAVLLVYLADSSVERWRIELGTGGLERDAAEPSGRAVREENELPTGGTGAPGPGAAAFVQAVLPTAAGTDWRIPALVDTGGRVLVIDAEGARWAALDAQAP